MTDNINRLDVDKITSVLPFKHIGKILNSYRKAHMVTNKTMAKKAGMSEDTLKAWNNKGKVEKGIAQMNTVLSIIKAYPDFVEEINRYYDKHFNQYDYTDESKKDTECNDLNMSYTCPSEQRIQLDILPGYDIVVKIYVEPRPQVGPNTPKND